MEPSHDRDLSPVYDETCELPEYDYDEKSTIPELNDKRETDEAIDSNESFEGDANDDDIDYDEFLQGDKDDHSITADERDIWEEMHGELFLQALMERQRQIEEEQEMEAWELEGEEKRERRANYDW
jgi:hypothetical protein